MGASRTFLDTNVLVYSVDPSEPAKCERALALLPGPPQTDYVVSAQVLGEFFNALTRKLGIADADADVAVRSFAAGAIVVPVDTSLVLDAIAIRSGASISYWDALIVAAAARGGCERILTEDLNDGQVIAGVKVVNPFAGL